MSTNKIEFFNEADFILTSTGNKISRSAVIIKPHGLEIPSGRVLIKCHAELNCQEAHIILNKYICIGYDTKLSPGHSLSTNQEDIKAIPLTIGPYTIIGDNCKIESAIIGTCCVIGNNVTLSPRTILKDYVYIYDNTYIPEDTVLPPFSIVSGNPCKIIGEVSESVTTLAQNNATQVYKNFKTKK